MNAPWKDRNIRLAVEEHSLNYFTNRVAPMRVFTNYLHDDNLKKRILFFYGDGGNGKSLFLSYLRKYFCRRLKDMNLWRRLQSLDDIQLKDELLRINPEEFVEVQSVIIDFDKQPLVHLQPQNPLSVVCYMRKELSGKKLKFLLFDYAYILYLSKTGLLTEARVKEVISDSAVEGIMEIAKICMGGDLPFIGTGLKIMKQIYGEKMLFQIAKRGISEEDVKDLHRMDPQGELSYYLPYLFAIDLNASMSLPNAPSRVVLFFDTHEAFWGNRRDISDYEYFQKDEWLRLMLDTLELDKGIIPVFAGREVPRWAEAFEYPIVADKIETHLVGHLSVRDADDYLILKGIDNIPLRNSIISYTQVEPGEVHPLYLGMCADIVIEREKKDGYKVMPSEFQEEISVAKKGGVILERFLRYVDRTVKPSVIALCACRGFDYLTYRELARRFRLRDDQPTYSLLKEYSFVKTTSNATFQIHQLIRKIVSEMPDYANTVSEANKILEEYHREKGNAGNDIAIAEAIYHANQLDSARGIQEWLRVFDIALNKSNWDLCKALIDISNHLILPQKSRIKNKTLDGRMLLNKGYYFFKLSLEKEAGICYLAAVEAFEEVLKIAKDNSYAWSKKGNALRGIGDIQTIGLRYEEAEVSYRAALSAYAESIKLAPQNSHAYNNKGIVLKRFGDLLSLKLFRSGEAVETYLEAVAVYDKSLQLAPKNINFLNNKGNALSSLGDLMVVISRHDEARTFYQKALALFEDALKIEPRFCYALNNKGNTFLSLANLETELERYTEAKVSYHSAIEVCCEVLLITPGDNYSYHCKGKALKGLGDLQFTYSSEVAEKNYLDAIAAFEAALQISPEYEELYFNRGKCFKSLGDLQLIMLRYAEAEDSFRIAIGSFEQVLITTPNDKKTIDERAEALKRLTSLVDKT